MAKPQWMEERNLKNESLFQVQNCRELLNLKNSQPLKNSILLQKNSVYIFFYGPLPRHDVTLVR